MAINDAGINEKKLEELILYIYESADLLSKKLENIESKVLASKQFYNSVDGDEFRKKFDSFIQQFDTIVDNMRRFGQDLTQVKFRNKQNNLLNVDIFK